MMTKKRGVVIVMTNVATRAEVEGVVRWLLQDPASLNNRIYRTHGTLFHDDPEARRNAENRAAVEFLLDMLPTTYLLHRSNTPQKRLYVAAARPTIDQNHTQNQETTTTTMPLAEILRLSKHSKL